MENNNEVVNCFLKTLYVAEVSNRVKILKNLKENTCTRVSEALPATVIKKRFWHVCFSVNFAKF